jgi:phosphoenolpyruvate carboxykinase (GTP)
MGRRAKNPPAVFQVNWFQRDDDGHFIWPGFGQNMHVLRWVREQALHTANGSHSRETSVGILPTTDVFPFADLGIKNNDAERLLSVDRDKWQRELAGEREFLAKFGDRLPRELVEQANQLEKRLG